MKIRCTDCKRDFLEDDYEDHVCEPPPSLSPRERRDRFNVGGESWG